MITIKVYVNKEKREVLQLNEAEARKVAQILLSNGEEFKSKGDLKAVMLGSMLETCANKEA